MTNGVQLGVIEELKLSPGGIPEVWVSWYGHVLIPEQPKRLKSEPFFKHFKIGDTITINSKHPEAAQKSFEINEFRGDGWILTKTNQLFNHDFIEKPSLISSESDEDLSKKDEGGTMSEMLEENLKKIVKETVNETLITEMLETVNETPGILETVEENDHEQSTTTIVEMVENHQPSNLTETEELTDDESRDRLHLERKVERAFYEAGKALQELRDRRLYRSTHQTFESYCLERFGFKRRHPYRLIDAAQVFDNLIEMCPNWTQNENVSEVEGHGEGQKLQMCPNWTQIFPTTEYQIRPLTNLEPEQQVEAWTQAVENAGGKVPSHRIVKSIVDQIRERTKVPNPWRVGEVASIIVKENPDLRGKGGCWAVITAVHDFSCTVRLWDGEYQVKPEHLKSLPYAMTDKDKNFFSSLGDRLSKIYNPQMEITAIAILSSLGKIDRPWLTELEERLLRVIEES